MQESSVEKFGAVHTKVKEGNEEQETTRGASLRELQRFFKEHDKDEGYAGLRRIADEDGTAVWTILKETEVAEQLEQRTKERREEERRHEKIFSAQARAQPEATDAASDEVDTLRAELQVEKVAREVAESSAVLELERLKADNENKQLLIDAQNQKMLKDPPKIADCDVPDVAGELREDMKAIKEQLSNLQKGFFWIRSPK